MRLERNAHGYYSREWSELSEDKKMALVYHAENVLKGNSITKYKKDLLELIELTGHKL